MKLRGQNENREANSIGLPICMSLFCLNSVSPVMPEQIVQRTSASANKRADTSALAATGQRSNACANCCWRSNGQNRISR